MYQQATIHKPTPCPDEHELFLRHRRAEDNLERALTLEEAMFHWRSRHLILVLTLNYKQEYRSLTTLDDIREDRDRFFENARTNKRLAAINGYVWRIEEGSSEAGLHMHIVIFYDRAFHADVAIAQYIGEYWATVATRGRGDYWNSNAYKARYQNAPWGDATGTVDRENVAKRESLRRLLGYLAKDDQHVSSRSNPYCRMFGTSRLPS